MSETTTIEDDRPANDQGESGGDAARRALREARQLIPISETGVQITNLDQQIDYAQTMMRATVSLPVHLRNKIGDCLAVIDIASRAGLSPYMVANKTYVQNDRLCFESQLFHAFAQTSGLLKGDLDVDWEGTGGERVCVITGVLKSDPTKPRVHRSPMLKDLHPGYSLKKRADNETSKKFLSYVEGQKLKAAGLPDGAELFSKGSPLWDRKPDVQMFYDTSRDWVRIYAPRAVLGIYTPEEMVEYGPENARDVTPQTSGVADRLRSSTVDRTEGHQAGHAAQEIDSTRNGGGGAPADETKKDDSPPTDSPIDAEVVGFSAKTVTALKAAKVATLAELLQMSEAEVGELPGVGKAMLGHIKTTLTKHGFALRVDEPAPAAAGTGKPTDPKKPDAAPAAGAAVKEAPKPKNLAEWEPYCRAWFPLAATYQEVRKRWNDERTLRNTCGITAEQREPVQNEMVARCKELGEPVS